MEESQISDLGEAIPVAAIPFLSQSELGRGWAGDPTAVTAGRPPVPCPAYGLEAKRGRSPCSRTHAAGQPRLLRLLRTPCRRLPVPFCPWISACSHTWQC